MNIKLWQPDPPRIAASNLTQFIGDVESRWGETCPDYADLHQWSVKEPEKFWRTLWDFAGVVGELPDDIVLQNADQMPGAIFFPNARINFAENLLRNRGESPALMFRGETGVERTLTGAGPSFLTGAVLSYEAARSLDDSRPFTPPIPLSSTSWLRLRVGCD